MSTDTQTGRAIDRYDRFVRHIVQVCRDVPERRASLRRGLGRAPEQAYGMHATVATWLPDPSNRAEEYALYAVASMIAAQSPSGRRGDDSSFETDTVPAEDAEVDTDTAGGDGEEPGTDQDSMGPSRRPSLGIALARAANGTETARRSIGKATAEKRLHLLVRQDLHGVHRHLPGLVRHIRSLDVPIDWAQLIDDLRRWDWDRDLVAKRWLQDYYRTVNPEE